MGMRINSGSGLDPQLVDKLIEAERLPIKKIEARKDKAVNEQKSFRELTGLISTLGSSLNGLRNKSDFYKLKLESSHPDIIDGSADNQVVPGTYEVEVRHLAKTQKLLAAAFPDKDKTPVGFGYIAIELDDGQAFDVEIDPDASTLQDVVKQINGAGAGVKAMIINTKETLENKEEDSFRLLVISEKTGKESRVSIDPDTTYLEFKEQVTGRNLDLLFEDVPVFDEDNTLEGLMPGLVLNAKKAEPGTKVTIKVGFDVEKSVESIKGLVDAYNGVNNFIDKQFQVDPSTNKAGILSTDNTLRTMRQVMQTATQYQGSTGKYRNLADVGITTDPKSGGLKFDEAKAKQAMTENYEEVAGLFIQSNFGKGFASAMTDAVKNVQNPTGGAIRSKERQLSRIIDGADDDIVRQERLVSQRADGIKRRFASLEGLLGNLNTQGQFIAARMGGG